MQERTSYGKYYIGVYWFYLQKIAEIIVNRSIEKFKDKKKKTPYQRKYKKTYNATWEVKDIIEFTKALLQGGKEDDITAIVTFAVSKSH